MMISVWVNLIILTVFFAGYPSATVAQEITTNALVNGSSICPGTRVSFTCETRGSFAIAWSSDEFIGTGNVQLLFAAGANVVGDNRRRNNAFDAEAVLDRNDDENGVQVLVSTLYITVLPNLPDGSVTCMHVGNGNTSSINIGVMADPGVPQDVFAIQIEHIEDSCIVTASWEDLMDSEAGIQNYNIYANQTDVSNDAVISGRTSDNHRISSLLLVPGCFVHEISVSAVNICGHEGPRSAVYRLNPDMRFVIPGSPSATDRPCDSGGKVNTGSFFMMIMMITNSMLVMTV